MGSYMTRTLNIGPGHDSWGTDKLDKNVKGPGIIKFDFNKTTTLPYKNNTFDEIRVHNIIQFMFHPKKILDECHRVLKPKGKISIIAPNASSLRYYFRPLGGHYSKGKGNWGFEPIRNMYNKYTLAELVRSSNFKIDKISLFRGKTALEYAFKSGILIRATKR
jgi:ubiquinone/menaquinone biosynthesis C-methylase UbiE